MAAAWLLFLPALQALLAGGASPTSGCKCLTNSQAQSMVGGAARITVTTSAGMFYYPPTYGSSCGKHLEPGDPNCYDTAAGIEKPMRAAYCNEPWCYVDPCTCSPMDISASTLFPGTNLYFSFSNCGGNSTAKTVAATCAAKSTPLTATQTKCSVKFDNGQTELDSCEPWAYLGKVVKANVSGKIWNYPANFGEGCGVHPEPGSTQCSDATGNPLPAASQAAWCKSSWSYVNPCSCDASDMVKGSYFNGVQAWYSYSVCGSTDSYTTGDTYTVDKDALGCPSPAPPAAAVPTAQSPPYWTYTKPNATPPCACQKIPADAVKACSKDWAQNGMCAELAAGPFKGMQVPPNYGTVCGVHLETNDPSCFNQNAQAMWPGKCVTGLSVGCRQGWCDTPWCYVDQKTCNLPDMALSAHFPNMYFSYSNCAPTTTTTTMAAMTVPVAGCKCLSHGQALTMVGGANMLMITNAAGTFNYPATYGTTCGKHIEPGDANCYDTAAGTESAAPSSYCGEPWCYVDPCTCSTSDIMASKTFPNSSLFYSYSNCGGKAASSVASATCAKTSQPLTAAQTNCSVKFDNGQPKVPSTASWAYLGLGVVATVGGKNWTYPGNYGEGCGVHLEPGSTDCSDANGMPLASGAKPWCANAWSYVNPCDCDASDITMGKYFMGRQAWYSYSVCGSTDSYTTGASAAVDKMMLGCPSPAPMPAAAQSPPFWAYSAPGQSPQACACLPIPASAIVACTKPWAQGGMCAKLAAGPSAGRMVAKTYGTMCGVHLEANSDSCFNTNNDMMWPSQCKPGLTKACRQPWCDTPWCYVDTSTCNLPDIQVSAHFTGMSFSYANCKPAMSSGPSMCPLTTSTTSSTVGTLSPAKSSVPTPGCKCMAHGQMMTLRGGSQKIMVKMASGTFYYPGTYGTSCGKHLEPGLADCYDTAAGTEKATQAAYCGQPWCYVDPCTCSPSDLAASTMFNGSNLYYSYSNCGGTPTSAGAVVDTSFCAAKTTPLTSAQTKCSMKFDNGAPEVNSSDPMAYMGKVVKAMVASKVWNYPANYGEGCGIHPEPGSADCSFPNGTAKALADQKQWCKNAWSYVNPCSCDASDIAKGQYFTQEVWYSYSVCGSTDSYTASATTPVTLDKVKVGCPAPAPPVSSLPNPPFWPHSSPKTKPPPCACLPLPDTAIKSCSQPWAQDGQCAEIQMGPLKGKVVAKNYGTTCGVHLETGSPSCFDQSFGKMWPGQCAMGLDTACRQAWCDRPWCYVDPKTCSGADVQLGQHFSNLWYSYDNCNPLNASSMGKNDSSTPSAVMVSTQILGLDYNKLIAAQASLTAIFAAVEAAIVAVVKAAGTVLDPSMLSSKLRAGRRLQEEGRALQSMGSVFIDTQINKASSAVSDAIASSAAALGSAVTTRVNAVSGIDAMKVAGATEIAAAAGLVTTTTSAPGVTTTTKKSTASAEMVANGSHRWHAPAVAACLALALLGRP